MFGIFGIFLQAAAGHMLYLALHLESGSFPRPLTAAEEQAAAFLKGRTLADEIDTLASLTVEDANALLQTTLLEENRAYVEIQPQE